jgi:hypothetical protein
LSGGGTLSRNEASGARGEDNEMKPYLGRLATAPIAPPHRPSPEFAGRAERKIGKGAGMTQLGVNHLTLKPGAMTSRRHWCGMSTAIALAEGFAFPASSRVVRPLERLGTRGRRP